jgi:hypothetical protein
MQTIALLVHRYLAVAAVNYPIGFHGTLPKTTNITGRRLLSSQAWKQNKLF